MKATPALAVLAILAAPALSPPPTMAADPLVVAPVTIQDRKAVFAQVESVDELTARARIGGTIADLSVDEGAMVQAGETLALVTDEKLALQMQALDARVQSLEAELSQARTDLNRADQLRRQGVIAQARLDEARTRVQVVARTVDSAKADRSVIAEQASQGAVLAPAGGRVLNVPVQNGSVVMPGESIAVIAADSYILRMELPERHARFLKEGDAVRVGPRGLEENPDPSAMRDGTVAQVYPRLTHGRVMADVRVDGLGDYFVGERALVYVPTGTRETVVLPEPYLSTRWGMTFATLADGTRVVVQPGAPVDGGVEILSGVRPGDEVVTP